MMNNHDFKPPSAHELARETALNAVILAAIHEHNDFLSFADFMSLALYHPQFGYYNAPTFAIGASGDFTTAPQISPLFAMCFANQCEEIFLKLPNADLLELGAGTGQFAKDLLLALAEKKCLPQHYYIYEISLSLRKKQQEFLQQSLPTLYAKIVWLDELPQTFSGIIIANEVLDALPVHRFVIDNGIKEQCVVHDGQRFVWKNIESNSALFNEKVSPLQTTYQFKEGYASEINLNLIEFLTKLTTLLDTGVMLFADYGYGEREYYHPERNAGTLTCFYQHHRHANPLILAGLQDITAHVNFTQVAEIAIENHAELLGYTSQSAFLLATGLIPAAEALTKNLSTEEEFKVNQAIKTLTLPSEMGERIKVMAIGKNIATSLSGFKLKDRRRDL